MQRGYGHYWCTRCRRGFGAGYNFCPGCSFPLSAREVIALDLAFDRGYVSEFSPFSFDPFTGTVDVNIPGTNLAIEPDGEVDIRTPFGDIPTGDFIDGDDYDDGGFWP